MFKDKQAVILKEMLVVVNGTQKNVFVVDSTIECDYWNSKKDNLNVSSTDRDRDYRRKEVDCALGLDINIGDRMELSYNGKVDGLYTVVDEMPYPSIALDTKNTLYYVRSVDG